MILAAFAINHVTIKRSNSLIAQKQEEMVRLKGTN